ncbi:hypothetical protein Tco_0624088 [Tanacetum coccineum]|uniref:Uncharacterized protein n=1 Tax=Tanacetum coccineum TaxID=301880 RepID=A0ABQ4WCY7_9ASTR
MYHDLYFCGKTLIEIENVGLTFAQVSSKAHREGVGLRVADSHTGNHPKVVLRHSKLFEGGADVPKALHNPITHLGNWKGSFFFIENKIIPSDYPELILGENKLDKKSFNDKVPLHPEMDPLYDQIATYPYIVRTFPDPILYLAGLKTTWEHSPKKPVIYHRGQGIFASLFISWFNSFMLSFYYHQCFVEMDFRRFMLGEVDGELNFLPAEVASEGRNSPSTKYVNNAPIIDATPLSSVYPSNVVENAVDSDDPSYGEDEQTLIGPSLSPHPEASKKFKILGKRKVAFDAPERALPPKVQKVPARASKVVGEASTPLDVDSDFDIHEFPSAKEEISIEQLCDIHDRAYMRQVVLNNLKKDRAYAELERKCNEALQDLDKNPLVSDMRVEIKDLQGQVDGLHNEYNMLILEEKKWACYEQILSSLRAKIEGIESERERLKSSEIKLLQEIDSLKQDRAVVVSKVVPIASMKLIRSDDLGVLVAKLVRSFIIYGRCQAFEEVAAMEEPFVLKNMSDYRPSSKEEYKQAGDALANASYPFLAEYVANPYASLEHLLSKKPPLLRPTFSGSRFKPLPPKVKPMGRFPFAAVFVIKRNLFS